MLSLALLSPIGRAENRRVELVKHSALRGCRISGSGHGNPSGS